VKGNNYLFPLPGFATHTFLAESNVEPEGQGSCISCSIHMLDRSMLGDIANGLTVDFVVHWKGDGNDDDYDYDIRQRRL
jgi:hypothetical protein